MVENPNINNSNQVLNASSPNGLNANPLSFKAGRVVNIVLDSSNEKFEEAGEWNGLGTIYYQDLTNPNNTLTLPAKPYLGNIKNYPLINEIVWIVTFPNT